MTRRVLAVLVLAVPFASLADEPAPAPADPPAAPSTPAPPTATAPTPSAVPPRSVRLAIGADVGFPYVFGIAAVGSLQYAGRRRVDVDLTWEPSVTLQSYSLGGVWHVLDSPFCIGGRVRLGQFQPPWAHGPSAVFFGVGPELGGRFSIATRGSINVALFATWFPDQGANLQTVFGLTAGFSWALLERAL
jgi:hypothetical protein